MSSHAKKPPAPVDQGVIEFSGAISLAPDRQYCVWCLQPLDADHTEYDGWGFDTRECVRKYQTGGCTCGKTADPACPAHLGKNLEQAA